MHSQIAGLTVHELLAGDHGVVRSIYITDEYARRPIPELPLSAGGFDLCNSISPGSEATSTFKVVSEQGLSP